MAEDGQVQISFTTKQQRYAVPNNPLLVPIKADPNLLNTLVNGLLEEPLPGHKAIEFDFLINYRFLRIPLIEHIEAQRLSTEDVIEVEYVEKHPPPEPQDCLIFDDWVSAVAVCEKWLLVGCYDSSVHIRTVKGKQVLSVPSHDGPVKDVAWISFSDDEAVFVSVSQDQTAKIWNWNIEENSVKCLYICKGHTREIETVAVNKTKDLMATGSWDQMVRIWSTATGQPTPKVSKSNLGQIRAPELTMKGHNGAITGLVWMETSDIITCSWDHMIKIWDVELGGMKQEIPGNKTFLDIDYSHLNRTAITASVDKVIRLYDPRSTEGTIIKCRFESHSQGVKCVRWSKLDQNLFISGGYDNNVKLWDARSEKAPLFDLTGHEDKVLCCDWSNPKFMVSGGADNTVRIFKSKYNDA